MRAPFAALGLLLVAPSAALSATSLTVPAVVHEIPRGLELGGDGGGAPVTETLAWRAPTPHVSAP